MLIDDFKMMVQTASDGSSRIYRLSGKVVFSRGGNLWYANLIIREDALNLDADEIFNVIARFYTNAQRIYHLYKVPKEWPVDVKYGKPMGPYPYHIKDESMSLEEYEKKYNDIILGLHKEQNGKVGD